MIDAGREREQVATDIWAHIKPLVDGINHAVVKLRKDWMHIFATLQAGFHYCDMNGRKAK